ncbi:MAG: hypothetical protein ACOVQX_00630 [Legionella sp.]
MDENKILVSAPKTSTHSPVYAPSENTLANVGWQAANFTTVLLFTSVSISLVQSPLNTVILNYTKSGQLFPSSPNSPVGMMSMVRHLYSGLSSNIAGSTMRSAYVTGTKKAELIEASEIAMQDTATILETESHQKKKTALANLSYVAAVALGDTMVTQVSDSYSQLLKAQIIQPNFNWKTPHNLFSLTRLGFVSRFNSGLVNYAALCLLEDKMVSLMPFDDERANHFISGAISGIAASVFTYPLSYYRDIQLLKTTVRSGNLEITGTVDMMSSMVSQLRERPPVDSVKSVLKSFAVIGPIRSIRTASIFSLVSGVGAVLGNEPLKPLASRLGLFSNSKKTMESTRSAEPVADDSVADSPSKNSLSSQKKD